MSNSLQSLNKSENYIQTTIFDAISVCREKKNCFIHFSKRMYQLSFLELCKLLVNDSLSIDEYKELLHILLENYRKEF